MTTKTKPTALQLAKNKLRRKAYAKNKAELAAQRLQHERELLPLVQQLSRDVTAELGRPTIVALRDDNTRQPLKVDGPWFAILLEKVWHLDDKGVYCFDQNGNRCSLRRTLLNGLRTTVHHRDGDPYNFERANLNAEPHAPRGVARKEHGSISESLNWNKRISLTGCDVTQGRDGVFKVITPKTRRRAMVFSELWDKEVPW